MNIAPEYEQVINSKNIEKPRGVLCIVENSKYDFFVETVFILFQIL